MAQKSNPIILRLLKTNRFFDSCWFNRSNYVYLLMRDFKIRNYINGILKTMNASSGRFLIQNLHNKQKINVFFCNLEKTKNRINRTLKQGSTSTPIKTRKLNVDRNLLYRNDKVSSMYSRVPRIFINSGVTDNLQNKELLKKNLIVHVNLGNNVSFCEAAHGKIFSFLNKHLNTIYKEKRHSGAFSPSENQSTYSGSLENNVYTAGSLNNRIKESMTIDKLIHTSLRYFIIKYYMVNSSGFMDSKFAGDFSIKNNGKHLEYGVHKSYLELYIKYFLKTRLNFIFCKMHEIFPIMKHFVLQKHKKKVFFSFLKHMKQYYSTKKMLYAYNSTKLQSLAMPKNTVNHVSTDVHMKNKYVFSYNLAEKNETSFFSVFRTIYFIDDIKNTNKHSKFFTFAKSLKFLYTPYTLFLLSSSKKQRQKNKYAKEENISFNTYNLKNTYLKAKNQFCNKLILNSVLKEKWNFPYTCVHNGNISCYVILSCINKQYLYTTYTNYCNMCVVDGIGKITGSKGCSSALLKTSVNSHLPNRNRNERLLIQQKPKSYTPIEMTTEPSQAFSFCKMKVHNNKMPKLYIPNTVYKRHMECVIQKNFLYSIPVNLHFFMSTNIFQNATYLMDIFVYYLEKKMPFFKLKNMVLKQLTELKPVIVKGVLVQCSGRVAMKSKKSQKAKTQVFKYGETGLHVFNSKLDFKSSSAFTSFGKIGIKIWICYF